MGGEACAQQDFVPAVDRYTYSMKTLSAGFFSFVIGFLLLTQTAAAQTVSSFSANPVSVQSGITSNLSWTLQDSTGYSMLLSCPVGVVAFTSGGSSYPCGSRQSVTSAGSDSLGLSFVNVTGTAQYVLARLYPKNGSGADVDAASSAVSISVSPVVNPITELSVSSFSPKSGSALTFTWESHYISGVNVRFDCGSDLIITSSQSTTAIPCNGAVAFSSDLAASGSQTVTVVNKSLFVQPLTIRLFPVITSGTYDATNAKVAEVSVLGMTPAADASAISFTTSSMTLASNATTSLSWVTAQARGANIQLTCTEDVVFFDEQGTALPCGQPAFSSSITAASSTIVRMQNKGTTRRPVRISLLLQREDGTYVTAAGRDLTVLLLMSGETNVTTSPTATATVATPSVAEVAKAHAPITRTLYKGVRHAQVSILQAFLALDSSIYPENSVSGYFGPATEAALKRFQKKYGIAKEGSSGFGLVGPATRAKINALTRP